MIAQCQDGTFVDVAMCTCKADVFGTMYDTDCYTGSGNFHADGNIQCSYAATVCSECVEGEGCQNL